MPLSALQQKAATLAAEDALTDEEIAAACGVSRASVTRWRRREDFQTRIAEVTATYAQSIVGRGIAERQNRVDALNDRWKRMASVIEARAVDPAMAAVPGGSTGLLVRQLKQIGAGRDAQVVEEYAVDAGLLKELRAHEQQAAQELGQWTEKREDTVSGGQTITIRFDRGDSDDDDQDVEAPLALPAPAPRHLRA